MTPCTGCPWSDRDPCPGRGGFACSAPRVPDTIAEEAERAELHEQTMRRYGRDRLADR